MHHHLFLWPVISAARRLWRVAAAHVGVTTSFGHGNVAAGVAHLNGVMKSVESRQY